MKNLILTLAVVLPLSTYANEAMRPEGVYNFKEAVIAKARDQELVPSMNTARFNVLVQNGYNCQLRGDFFNCVKFLKNIELPESIRAEVSRMWKGRFFEFIQSASLPSVTNESESVLEWDIFDTVKFEGAEVREYHYYLTKGHNGESDIHKFVLDFLTGPRWMVVEDENRLTTPIQKIERKDYFKSRIFDLSLVFNR